MGFVASTVPRAPLPPAPLSECCLDAVHAASLTFAVSIRMSNRHWDINKAAQSNQYGHGSCPCLCFMIVFAFFSLPVFYFCCFSVIYQKKKTFLSICCPPSFLFPLVLLTALCLCQVCEIAFTPVTLRRWVFGSPSACFLNSFLLC